MTSNPTRIQKHFNAHLKALNQTMATLMPTIEQAAEHCLATLLAGQKILIAGNGGSACDAQHFAGELINRYQNNRAPLPCIALGADGGILTAIGNDHGFESIFSKQIEALGNPGDCLIAITTSGQSDNIDHAIQAAIQAKMSIILLSGRDGGKANTLLRPEDLSIIVPSDQTAAIQEMHITLLHSICDVIETEMIAKTTVTQTHPETIN